MKLSPAMKYALVLGFHNFEYILLTLNETKMVGLWFLGTMKLFTTDMYKEWTFDQMPGWQPET